MELNIEDREAMEKGLASLREIAETSGRTWGEYETFLFKWAWLDGSSNAFRSVKIIPIPMAENGGNVE